MAALIYGALGWLSAKLVSSLLARIFGFLIVGTIAVSIVHSITDFIFTNLGSFSAIDVLLLAGVGDALAIVGSAVVFRVTIMPHVIRLSGGGS